MGRRGYLSTLGASASLAAAGVFALLLVSAAIAFDWTGVEESAPRESGVTLRTVAPTSERSVALPSRKSIRSRLKARKVRAVRARARQGVKAATQHGGSRKAKAAATPTAPREPESVGTAAPTQPVDDAVDGVQKTVQDTAPQVADLVDPIVDDVQDVPGGTTDAVDHLLDGF